MKLPLFRQLAILIQARENCRANGADEWLIRHGERVHTLAKRHLPSGSGIDTGTLVDLDKSKPGRLVLGFSYHHMDGNGMYTHWTDHEIIVTPSLTNEFDLRITGRSPRNDDGSFKEHLHETYSQALAAEIDPHIELAKEAK